MEKDHGEEILEAWGRAKALMLRNPKMSGRQYRQFKQMFIGMCANRYEMGTATVRTIIERQN